MFDPGVGGGGERPLPRSVTWGVRVVGVPAKGVVYHSGGGNELVYCSFTWFRYINLKMHLLCKCITLSFGL